jgi:hypothetical protein
MMRERFRASGSFSNQQIHNAATISPNNRLLIKAANAPNSTLVWQHAGTTQGNRIWAKIIGLIRDDEP